MARMRDAKMSSFKTWCARTHTGNKHPHFGIYRHLVIQCTYLMLIIPSPIALTSHVTNAVMVARNSKTIDQKDVYTYIFAIF
jgi:hypothetical protein